MQTEVKGQKMLLAGRWVEASESFAVYDPQDHRLLGKVPRASKAEMEQAIVMADEAFRHIRNWSTFERMRVINNAADYIEKRKEEYARIIASEGSKTINEARKEVKRCIQTLRLSAEEARRINGETINFDQSEGSDNRIGYYYRFPIGVIGAITPFNDPLNLVAHKVGPALAAGNPIIVKPASVTPLSAFKLAEAFVAAGLPEGFLSVLTGSGKEIGEILVTHPLVKMVSFTGGTEAGEQIAHQAGVKKMNMELGSNSPVIILKDADLQDTIQSCVAGAFSAVGQNCIGVQRIYIEEELYQAFLRHFVERTAELQVGDKMDELTDMGPLINEQEARRVEAWVEEALELGASLRIGGKRDGNFYLPTILTDVPETATIAKEEVFGPVVIVYPVKNIAEAIERSNSVAYGLQAGIFTSNIEKAFQAVRGMEVGGIMINDTSDYRVDAMPFGGVKGSGLGREGVKSAIEKMTDPKVVCIRLKEEIM